MQYRLTSHEITVVEAVYLTIITRPLLENLHTDLITFLYRTNIYMYIYICWLLKRWGPLYAQNTYHLPKRYHS